MSSIQLKYNRLASHALWLSVALALSIGILKAVTAEEIQPPQPALATGAEGATAIPDPASFMMGRVSFTWTYRSNQTMPFTEHHSISSEDLTEALDTNGPVRITTEDAGELLIVTAADSPNVILSARHYEHWTLISVLRSRDDSAHSAGVFKFCSSGTAMDSCVERVLKHPDGTVTMTNGSANLNLTEVANDLGPVLITEELVALLTL